MEQRYAVAGCLLQGKVYSEIRRETGASSATVSRVNRMLNFKDSCNQYTYKFYRVSRCLYCNRNITCT